MVSKICNEIDESTSRSLICGARVRYTPITRVPLPYELQPPEIIEARVLQPLPTPAYGIVDMF